MKRHTRRNNIDLDIVINLAEVSPNTTVADLQEIAERNRYYKTYFSKSKLTKEGWCEAMCISTERHAAYLGLRTPAPNSILNKAKMVSSRALRLIKLLHNKGL